MGVSSQYIKGVDFNLSAVSSLSAEEPKFQRIGYTFAHWKDVNGVTYTDKQLVSFNLDSVDLSAQWTINQYSVSWQTPANGSIEVKAKGIAIASGTKVDYKTILTITAIPDLGYKLNTLTVNGQAFVSGQTYEVGTENITVAASFSDNTGIITYWPGY